MGDLKQMLALVEMEAIPKRGSRNQHVCIKVEFEVEVEVAVAVGTMTYLVVPMQVRR